ncbi:GntR family transcriptional regulator [Paraburkholderia sp.]|uniref:GntR family transcriptional regulator n=1 Tax=Paraburkholderia sp. TaxID=1926495 RepID=UPI0039E3D9D3
MQTSKRNKGATANPRAKMEVVRRSLDVLAADKLRDAITSGGFEPGERLTEEDLAASVGLSRGTVRLALRQLMHEGLVTQEPFKGYAVPSLSANDATELYTLRNSLEGFAARLLAEQIDLKKAQALDKAFNEVVTAVQEGDRRRAVAADFELHMVIVRLTGHSRLETHYGLISQQMRLYQKMVSQFLTLDDYVELHAPLIQAIKEGRSVDAQRIASEHNTEDGEKLVKELTQREEVARKAG